MKIYAVTVMSTKTFVTAGCMYVVDAGMTNMPRGKPAEPTSVTVLDTKVVKNAVKPFIGWDGEATQDAGYCLLGCSKGDFICSPYLSTSECFEFLLSMGTKYKHAHHVGFAFDYDVNNILRDLPWPHLIMLKERGRVRWKQYRIRHVPGKFFSLSDGNRRIRIEDIFTFFRTAYCTNNPDNPGALDKYGIGSRDIRKRIADGKDDRPDFLWKVIEEIIEYMMLELECMPPLMNKIRECCNAASLYLNTWTGPAALAKCEFKKQGIRNHMGRSPDAMQFAVRSAYAGGWFERFKAGVYYGPVYTADLNSAYTWAMTLLPSLANGEWRYVDGERARDYAMGGRRFGIFHLSYGTDDRFAWDDYMRACRGIPLPLFHRAENGNISRPFRGSGWWWNFEASQVARNPRVRFEGAWIYDGDGVYPFEFAGDVYDTRLLLQQIDDPAEKALKWMLASAYGVLAQRAGWDRRSRIAPDWHQLEWAGAITSACRSLIYTAAMPVAMKDGLVSIDTDGIISTQPFLKLPHGKGNGLGQWKCEQYSGLVYIQNGVYWLRNMSGVWEPPKTRGIPRGQIGDVEVAIDSLARTGGVTFSRHSFVGYGSAIHRKDRSSWRTWEDRKVDVSIKQAGSRIHVEKLCRACRSGLSLVESLHDLALIPAKEVESAPHRLPWLEEDDEAALHERIRHEVEAHEMNELFA